MGSGDGGSDPVTVLGTRDDRVPDTTWRRDVWWAALAGFALVALSVELDWWRGLDRSVSDWVLTQRRTWPWDVAKLVVDVANPGVALPVTLAVGLLLAWRRRTWEGAVEAAARIGLVVASVLLVKPLLAVPGPSQDALGQHGGAFPSGHTTSAVVCAALLLAWAGRPRAPGARLVVAALAVVVVGFSVVYVHYHYVSDVVGGLTLGSAIATLPLPWLRRLRR